MKEPPINWRLGHISYAATVSQRLIFTKFESIYKVSWCKHKDMEHSNFAIAHNLAMNRFARGITSRLYIRSIYLRNTTNFVVPENYKSNRSLLKQLPWKTGLDIWWKSLSPNRLSDLQKELVKFMLPSHLQENQRIIKELKKQLSMTRAIISMKLDSRLSTMKKNQQSILFLSMVMVLLWVVLHGIFK